MSRKQKFKCLLSAFEHGTEKIIKYLGLTSLFENH